MDTTSSSTVRSSPSCRRENERGRQSLYTIGVRLNSPSLAVVQGPGGWKWGDAPARGGSCPVAWRHLGLDSSASDFAHPLALRYLMSFYRMCSQNLICALGSSELSVREILKSRQPMKKTDVNHLFLQKPAVDSKLVMLNTVQYKRIDLSTGEAKTASEALVLW